jgi:acetyl esterase/lipase
MWVLMDLTRISCHAKQMTNSVPLLRRSSVGAGSLARTACEQAVAHRSEKCGLSLRRRQVLACLFAVVFVEGGLAADGPAVVEAAKNAVPEKFELPFAAADRDAAMVWQERARKRLFELVAAQTPQHPLTEKPLDFRIESSEERGDYTFHCASFCCNDGDRRKCLWAKPKGRGPFPAMLCLHGHGGTAEEVFDGSTVYGGFAHRFARGGYCVLAPSFPHRDYAASTLWDLMRCVDILSAQKEVDSKRIGVMGLSMGGEWTMWLAACDQRLKAAVVSGWMCTTEGVFAVPNCRCWELPGFVDLMDVCEVHLLIAPRPVLFESAEGDPCFPIRYTREGFALIRSGYKVFGAEEACRQDVFPGGHAVHGTMAYPFIDKILGGRADVEEATQQR